MYLETFPRVSRDADLLGILGMEGFTIFCLEVHCKSEWGEVSQHSTISACIGVCVYQELK